ncbi:hypothetical protein [Arenimonas sp. MALMAid1274]|uniref:hypothetical protein n=1 Tax=Arenimonas sp. MALMAid1274 TaxID=3411630 RepID=UPI003BA27B4C
MRPPSRLLSVLASGFFVPATTLLVGVPIAHALSHAQARDLTRGAAPHRALEVPLVDRKAPGFALAFDAGGVEAALRQWPGLTVRLPPSGNLAGQKKGERLEWRVVSDRPAGQHVQLVRQGGRYTLTLDYVATESGIVPLRSRELSLAHAVQGMALGLLVALVFQRGMRRWQQGRTRPGVGAA